MLFSNSWPASSVSLVSFTGIFPLTCSHTALQNCKLHLQQKFMSFELSLNFPSNFALTQSTTTFDVQMRVCIDLFSSEFFYLLSGVSIQ